ncbi:MAG: FAD-dependent oxidoreductase, partial [Elusimicrobia bacterium]|nr:FAD-dependent oxidoreductase [Elusimicrobiota bacterium]
MIGGGIAGAGILRELASRGVPDCFLFEKADFASATSGASSKLIHAGIRYLEQSWERLKDFQIGAAWRDFKFVVAASRERKILSRLAPGLIQSKEIHFVLGAGDGRSASAVWVGTWLYYLIQLAQGQIHRLPRAFYRSASIRRWFPELDAANVRAVYTFYDGETDDARLVIENLQSAHDAGAEALNYVELVAYERREDGVRLELRDAESGETASVEARVLINAAGPFVDEVAARGNAAPAERTVDRVAGAHIDVYPALTRHSYYVTASDQRLVFVLRREEDGLSYTRIGTTERPLASGEATSPAVATEGEIAYLKSLVRSFFPSANLEAGVTRIDAGVRPLRAQSDKNPFEKTREHDIVGGRRVYHVVGVKLTDHRRVAAELLSRINWAADGVPAPRPGEDERPIRKPGPTY